MRTMKPLVKMGAAISARSAGAQSCDPKVLGELYLLFREVQPIAASVAQEFESKRRFSAIYAQGDRNIAEGARAVEAAARRGERAYAIDRGQIQSCDAGQVLQSVLDVELGLTAATNFA